MFKNRCVLFPQNLISVQFCSTRNLNVLEWSVKVIDINSLPASGNSCCLLITFANSLDADQAGQNIGPDLDPDCLILWWYSWKIFFEKIMLKKKIPQMTKKHAKLSSMQIYPACKEWMKTLHPYHLWSPLCIVITKYFLQSFSPFHWFKKGSCQFLEKRLHNTG